MMKEVRKFGIFIFLVVGFLSYSGFLYTQSTDLKAVAGTSKDRGKKIWQEKNCIACHQIYGLGGFLGADLTNSYSQKGPDYIQAFLKSGTTTMPNFYFSEEEITDLTAYLKSIDGSGIGMPSKLKINNDGTIQQP